MFHPLQELSVQLFAQLETDTKGTEEEADGNGWYRFACVHKVCFRNLASVQRYMAFLQEAKGVQKLKSTGERKARAFSSQASLKFCCFARDHSRSIRGLKQVIREHFECWTIADESDDKSKIEYVLY